MAAQEAELAVRTWDAEQFKVDVGTDYVREEEGKPEEASGEPITIIVVTLGLAAISGITGWLLKNRHRKTIKISAKVHEESGATREFNAEVDVRDSVSDADVVKQLQGLFPPSVVEQFLGKLD